MKTNYSVLLVLILGMNSFTFRTIVSFIPTEPKEEISEEIEDRSNDVNYHEFMKNLENEEV